jgi:hypothetical protein
MEHRMTIPITSEHDSHDTIRDFVNGATCRYCIACGEVYISKAEHDAALEHLREQKAEQGVKNNEEE